LPDGTTRLGFASARTPGRRPSRRGFSPPDVPGRLCLRTEPPAYREVALCVEQEEPAAMGRPKDAWPLAPKTGVFHPRRRYRAESGKHAWARLPRRGCRPAGGKISLEAICFLQVVVLGVIVEVAPIPARGVAIRVGIPPIRLRIAVFLALLVVPLRDRSSIAAGIGGHALRIGRLIDLFGIVRGRGCRKRFRLIVVRLRLYLRAGAKHLVVLLFRARQPLLLLLLQCLLQLGQRGNRQWAGRNAALAIVFLLEGQRRRHKAPPDWSAEVSARRAGHRQIACHDEGLASGGVLFDFVGVGYPDGGRQVARVADKPGVASAVGRSCLAA